MHEGRKNGKERHQTIKKNHNDDQNKINHKVNQALNLPVICNINPRSIYNKKDEFETFVEEQNCDLILMSESWERDYLTLDQLIHLPNHTIISNVSQRRGIGGRPAIFVNNQKFNVQNITNTLIQVPWGVEAIW